MAYVTRRRYRQKISTVSLLNGTVETTLIRRAAGPDATSSTVRSVQISVWEIIEDGERDRMERYVFELNEAETRKLIEELIRHFPPTQNRAP
jgi:hypothetical protein